VIRAVLDANVIVSGMVRFRTGQSAPSAILRAWVNDDFELLISDHIFDEVGRTLSKPYFRAKVDPNVLLDMLSALATFGTPVDDRAVVSGVATHPEDDRVLSAAVSALADFLVTGDRQLQRLEAIGECAIVSPHEFQTILDNT
jgi:putative PIN family toxin of toxin-antitoxin system